MLIDDTDAEIVFPKIFANLLEQLFYLIVRTWSSYKPMNKKHSKNFIRLDVQSYQQQQWHFNNIT